MKPFFNIILIALTAMFLPAKAQTPKLNSYPAATATVFIDFDGQHVSGTAWNMSGDIDAAASGFNAAAITEIFNRVAEDYRPFSLNITTDSAVYWAAPAKKRMRVIVTPTSAWYGSSGGVAYVGSFTWGDNTPAWVFSALLGNRTKWVAEAIAHEAGHTLGLQHQSVFDASCNKTLEYSTGTGTGEIGWAPIMGASYYRNHTTWNTGPNTIGCSSIQNDIDIISTKNGFGLRADDHGNDNSTATAISIAADTFAVSGLVNSTTDVDVFKLVLPATTWLKLNAIPHNVGTGDDGANVDIKVTLLNGSDTINSYNPSTLLNAGVDTNLNAGIYYLVIDGVGNIYHDDVGSMGLFNISGSIASVLPVKNFHLSGNDNNGYHQLNWTLQADEAIKALQLESSADGKSFTTLAIFDNTANSYSLSPTGKDLVYYRLKAITANDGRVYMSNTIVLKNKNAPTGIQILGNYTGTISVKSNDNFVYQLYTGGGQEIRNGKLVPGINQLNTMGVKGLLLLHCSNGSQSFTQKLIQQ